MTEDAPTSGSAGADPLALDADEMRAMGYRVVDLLVDRIARLPSEPVLRVGSRAELEARIHGPAPEAAVAFEELLERLDRDVLPFVGQFAHPRFFGYIPGAGTWPGALGDLIASAMNIDSGSWREASGASQLELTVLDWFRSWIGYPSSSAGVLVSGGSAANLAAIACARETLIGAMTPRIVIYTSDQSHSSVARAARHLGFGPDQVRVVPTDASFRMAPSDVAAAMDADIAQGRIPFLVAAVAGSTNTGAIDDLGGLAELCRSRGVWLHVDGAYGGFAALTTRGRAAMPDLALADSITLDPHKWLAMPFEVGCLMVRDGAALEHAFEIHPEYLKETSAHGRAVNFADRGLQLTRVTRAIKVWLALSTFGIGAFRDAIDRAMDLTLLAESVIRDEPRLELVTPASLGVLTFRHRGPAGASPGEIDRANVALVQSLAASGDVLLTGTTIRGRYAIRLCVLNHTSGEGDVRYALERVASAPWPEGAAVDGRRRDGRRDARDAGVDMAWLRTIPISPGRLRRVAPFASVTDEQARRFLSAGRERVVVAGEEVTVRWSYARTFSLVLSGRLAVRLDERQLGELGADDHFGEIAAIDWGRDFSYGRTATVVAVEPTKLLEIPASALRDLMAEAPDVDRELRRIAQERLERR
jgi:glutamate/tyrosine decarboxylase-like PLP-dependent enzyme